MSGQTVIGNEGNTDELRFRTLEPQHFEHSNATRNWFWKGLPAEAAFATCISGAYSAVWPEFYKHSRLIGDAHRIVVSDRFGKPPPQPPEKIVGRKYSRETEFSDQTRYDQAEIVPIEQAPDDQGRLW